jgi:hypothetical protein
VTEIAARNAADRAVVWLLRSWWIVFCGFAAVVLVFVRERACYDRFDLLPSVATQPSLAWLLATFYLFAHCWLLAAYVVTAKRTGQLVPGFGQIAATWGSGLPQLLLMLALFGLEYAPAGLWTSLGRSTGLCVPGP